MAEVLSIFGMNSLFWLLLKVIGKKLKIFYLIIKIHLMGDLPLHHFIFGKKIYYLVLD